ncbi:MAG: hypothetical protein I3270_01240 [Candidatus Moeniiplasma glomeromycotorum]|nr:hypothetical protein [Candidatus Moeniiplasma glomeromycotorum]MCE8162333.1 hypothetical protein [Candidatus Moeniiplasma glomeromycotorum]MCE8166257.1 hypothetical protein [Candidatus Moeniiplasma glomeromycotorum]MCE8166739.1 hypothetical protein [Candidatus Moeniiplasma glomeromycotorum]
MLKKMKSTQRAIVMNQFLTNKSATAKKAVPTEKILVINKIEDYLLPELTELYHQKIKQIKNLGYQIEKITIPKRIRDHLQITYLILCSTELVSHLNSLQGITYGVKRETPNFGKDWPEFFPGSSSIRQKRDECLGKIVKQRLLIGAYFLENQVWLKKAQQMRFLVYQWVKKIFQKGNFLLFPCPNSPPPRADSFDHSFTGLVSSHWSDNLLLIANFVGLPSLNLPLGFVNGLPVSININGAYGKDKMVLELAEKLEN